MAGRTPTIGVLALQGGFAVHTRMLERVGSAAREVRRVDELDGLDGLVLPGGESTTLLNLMRDEPWFEAIREFHETGHALLATCAGTILLALDVIGPAQSSIGLLDAQVERNAYGRQIDSFETTLETTGDPVPRPAVFIRAPIIRRIGGDVTVLATYDGLPVLVQQQTLLAATFHPELTDDPWLHARFVESIRFADSATCAAHRDRARLIQSTPGLVQ